MTTVLPYRLEKGNTTSLIDVVNPNHSLSEENISNLDVKCAFEENINPLNYNWAESVNNDLFYLKDLGLLTISQEDITQISSQIKSSITLEKSDGQWTEMHSGGNIGLLNPLAGFPTLPLKEFSLIKKSSSNLIYWIVGIILVVVILSFVLMRRKK